MDTKSPEREALEARATELSVSFQPNIGDAKLEAKVAAAELKAEAKAKAEANAAAEAEAKAKADADAKAAAEAEAKAKADAEAKAGAEANAGADVADGPHFKVVGPRNGRWRAGWHFTREPVLIAADEVTAEMLEALEGDPKLTVSFIEPAE